ncbi:ABC transporter permease [Actinomadura madurae]|uniref:ABC transporter permease n=1 Tax=Actinomadura madurae TaxID=1993 RepID=UPI0020271DE5|nr:ABC transporter permease [Actinomadura madurae]MCP9954944.1 ABC transporter permease [Actinomadura madurae]MCP9971684.1 ABC transporter permease [Actinomadura madurae]MCP9984186.1 ABC transporter permease [Actinomadura madurae]MCQ0004262.1 ABC transporter permease [Actinomadura madurae]MCQ0020388.1 ABC transporter permease [Actinomadura madurae]
MKPSAVLSVARLDLTLLWRNRTALFTVFGLPVLFAVMLVPAKGNEIDGVDGALLQGTGHLGFFLVFAVFMNLVTVFTARREDRTLKRLRGTALSDAEITGGSVLTATAMYAVQAVALVVVLAAGMGGRMPADPVLMLAGLAGGVVVFATLAFAVSGITPNAELAQLTVLPIMFGCMLGGGVMFPLESLPEWGQQICRLVPLSPVVEIVRTGYFGQDFVHRADHPSVGLGEGWLTCVRPFLVLLFWAALGRVLATRWFRWEPRHA